MSTGKYTQYIVSLRKYGLGDGMEDMLFRRKESLEQAENRSCPFSADYNENSQIELSQAYRR
jgi:hypothetical protein